LHPGPLGGHRRGDGRPFGAQGEAVGGVFHVAAGKHLPLLGQQRRAHLNPGIRGIGPGHNLPSRV
jgi:hypothetical protein